MTDEEVLDHMRTQVSVQTEALERIAALESQVQVLLAALRSAQDTPKVVDHEERIIVLENDMSEFGMSIACLLELAHQESRGLKERNRILETYVLPTWERTKKMTKPVQATDNKKAPG